MTPASGPESTRSHYERWFYEDTLLSPGGEYFGGSYFANYGYWEPETQNAREACENLMEKLLAFIPDKSGTILDVACGLGATTRHVVKHYASDRVTGVDFSEKNLETCRRNAPGVTFRQMDATRLEFPDASFDSVISVEAAFHFNTREQFLHEAKRVLKPGGRLVVADVLHERWADSLSKLLHPQNHVPDPQSYAGAWRRAGFGDVQVVDVTEESWTRSNAFGIRYLCDQFRAGRVDRKTFNRMMTTRLSRLACTRYYILATGVRPIEDRPRAIGADPVDGVEFAPDWVGPGPEPVDGLKTLVTHALWSGAERTLRLRQTALVERGLALRCRQRGDARGARRHAAMALACLQASLPRRGGR